MQGIKGLVSFKGNGRALIHLEGSASSMRRQCAMKGATSIADSLCKKCAVHAQRHQLSHGKEIRNGL